MTGEQARILAKEARLESHSRIRPPRSRSFDRPSRPEERRSINRSDNRKGYRQSIGLIPRSQASRSGRVVVRNSPGGLVAVVARRHGHHAHAPHTALTLVAAGHRLPETSSPAAVCGLDGIFYVSVAELSPWPRQ